MVDGPEIWEGCDKILQPKRSLVPTAAREGSMHDQDPYWVWRAVGGEKFATSGLGVQKILDQH